MQIEMTGGQLGELGEPAGQGQTRHRMTAQIFQRAADKIAHIDQRLLGQSIKPLHGLLGGRAGRGGDMVETGGAGHVDAALDRVDPRRAGIRHDDAGRAEHRQPADDAEPLVHRLGRERSPPGIAIVTVKSGDGAPFASAISASWSRIIARGAGLIAGSPGASGRPGRVTVPTPSPARKTMPLPGAAHRSAATISAPCVTSGRRRRP